jgi:hypothetical protein
VITSHQRIEASITRNQKMIKAVPFILYKRGLAHAREIKYPLKTGYQWEQHIKNG